VKKVISIKRGSEEFDKSALPHYYRLRMQKGKE